MTSHLLTPPAAGPGESDLRAPAFATSSGLRALLNRLHAAGRSAWRSDPDATALLAYTIERYAPLTRAWHRDPADAATAAFLAMIHDGVRCADDPWAVVTRAVQVSLAAENHAERHLTSTEKARRAQHDDLDAPVRAGEYTDILFTMAATSPVAEDTGGDGSEAVEPAPEVIADATALLTALDWPVTVAGPAVQYLCGRLADAGSVLAAYETLRRDAHLRAQLDLDRVAWNGLVRLMLGARPQPGRPTRKGVLARLLLGETVTDLLADHRVVRAVLAALAGDDHTADRPGHAMPADARASDSGQRRAGGDAAGG